MFTTRHWLIAVAGAIAVALLIGVATVLIPNSIFARDIAPVWWNYPVLITTAILTGLVMATYVRTPYTDDDAAAAQKDRGGKLGIFGTVLAWFAVGCPVCNKIALLAFGYSGAIAYFAPVQPFLAIGAMLLTGVALIWRLKGMVACSVKPALAA